MKRVSGIRVPYGLTIVRDLGERPRGCKFIIAIQRQGIYIPHCDTNELDSMKNAREKAYI